MMNNKNNLPIVSILAAVFLVIVAAIIIIIAPATSADAEKTILTLIVTLVPSLVASAFAERASRDIRNGVVVDKVKQGTTAALVETGVVEPGTTPTVSDPPAVTTPVGAPGEPRTVTIENSSPHLP